MDSSFAFFDHSSDFMAFYNRHKPHNEQTMLNRGQYKFSFSQLHMQKIYAKLRQSIHSSYTKIVFHLHSVLTFEQMIKPDDSVCMLHYIQ